MANKAKESSVWQQISQFRITRVCLCILLKRMKATIPSHLLLSMEIGSIVLEQKCSHFTSNIEVFTTAISTAKTWASFPAELSRVDPQNLEFAYNML